MKKKKYSLKRVFHRLSAEEQEKARKHAQLEARKSMRYDTTNAEFAKENATFRKACEAAGVEPTTRQASKYRNGQGIAYKTREGLA